jgi:hypothetical protein
MIYFTELGSKKPIAFNPQHIVSVEESLDTSHSKIRTTDGHYYHVDQKQYDVVGEIAGALKT